MRRNPSPPAPKIRYKGAYKVVSIIQIECIGKPGKPERAGKKSDPKDKISRKCGHIQRSGTVCTLIRSIISTRPGQP